MKTCSVCQKEITSQMIRHGAAISRGSSLFHRDCHRSAKTSGMPLAPPPLGGPVASGAPGPPMGTSYPDIPEAVEYASFWRRWGSHIIDSFIMNVILFAVSFLIGFGTGMFGLAETNPVSIIGAVVAFVAPVAYCIVFWTRTGATPGKAALGVRVVSAGGGPLTGGQSFVRYIGYLVSTLVFCLGFLAMLWDDENRCWHDRMAGTRVIRT